MANWDERIREHAVFDVTESLLETLEVLESEDPIALDLIDRAKVALRQLDKYLRASPAQFLGPETLDQMNTQLNRMKTQLDAFQTSGDTGELDGASNSLTGAIASAAPLALARDMTEAADVGELVRSYRATYESLVDNLREQVDGMSDRISAARTKIDTKVSEARQESESALASLTETVERLSAEATQEKSRLSEAIDRQNDIFANSQDERQSEFQTLLESLRSQFSEAQQKFDNASETRLERFSTLAKDTLADMEQLKKSSTRLAELVARASTAGGFEREAVREGKRALLWSIISVVALLILTGFGVISVLQVDDVTRVNIHTSLLRLSVVAALLTLAGYAGSQARSHRNAERQARQFDLEMAAIGPYTSPLPEDDQRLIRDFMTLRIFGQFIESESGDSDVVPESLGNVISRIRAAFPSRGEGA
jgi:hypothetical protein